MRWGGIEYRKNYFKEKSDSVTNFTFHWEIEWPKIMASTVKIIFLGLVAGVGRKNDYGLFVRLDANTGVSAIPLFF